MKYDYLVENQAGDRFTLVPRDDPEHGLVRAVRSERTRQVLAELGLAAGFLSQYMTELATTGSVSKDLLIEEGLAIEEELEAVYEHIKRVEIDEDGFENDVTMTGKTIPEVEVAWWALRANYGVQVLDRSGYTEIGLDPFNIDQPTMPTGCFVNPSRIGYPFTGVSAVIELVGGLEQSGLTHFVDQQAVTYDTSGTARHVDDARHLTVGTVNARGEFQPVATLLDPFQDEADLF